MQVNSVQRKKMRSDIILIDKQHYFHSYILYFGQLMLFYFDHKCYSSLIIHKGTTNEYINSIPRRGRKVQ